jgi:hypothetical protein
VRYSDSAGERWEYTEPGAPRDLAGQPRRVRKYDYWSGDFSRPALQVVTGYPSRAGRRGRSRVAAVDAQRVRSPRHRVMDGVGGRSSVRLLWRRTDEPEARARRLARPGVRR